MSEIVQVEEILKLLSYHPYYIGDSNDTVRHVDFMAWHGNKPTIDIWTKNEGRGQYFCFEIIDTREFKKRIFRKSGAISKETMVFEGFITRDNIEEIAKKINKSLVVIYRRKKFNPYRGRYKKRKIREGFWRKGKPPVEFGEL